MFKEDEDDGEVEEDDMLEVEMVARLLVGDDVGDGATPVVAVSLDFIADRLLAVAVADVDDVEHTYKDCFKPVFLI